MNFTSKFILLILSAAMLQACNGGMNKQGGGTLIGGATGALIGAQFGRGSGALVATGIGALAGALIGGQIGASMDENDRALAEATSRRALETARTGQAVAWSNPDNGHRGSVTPTRTFQDNSGQYCREYTQKVVVGGKSQDAYGRACRKPDGSWEIAN
jgi:surface antigen